MQYLELAPPKCFGHGRPGARPAGAGKRPRGVSGLLGGLLCAPHRKQQSLSRFTIGGCCATKSRIRLCALSHHKRARCRSGRPQRPGVMALKKSDTAAFWGDDSVPATPYSPRDPYSGSPSGRFHPSPQQVRAYTPPSSDEAEIPQGVTEAAFWGCEDYLARNAGDDVPGHGSQRARHAPVRECCECGKRIAAEHDVADEVLSQSSTLDMARHHNVQEWLMTASPGPSLPQEASAWHGHRCTARRSLGLLSDDFGEEEVDEVDEDIEPPRAALALRRRYRISSFNWSRAASGAEAEVDTPDVDVASGVWGLIRTPRVRELRDLALRVGQRAKVKTRHGLLFSPDGTARRAWDFAGMVLVGVLIMLQVINERWMQQHSSWIFADVRAANPHTMMLVQAKVLLDFFFIADIFVKLRTAYVDERGHLVTDSWRIARRYASNWLLCDIFCALPLEILDLAPDPAAVQRRLANNWFARATRATRVLEALRRARNTRPLRVTRAASKVVVHARRIILLSGGTRRALHLVKGARQLLSLRTAVKSWRTLQRLGVIRTWVLLRQSAPIALRTLLASLSNARLLFSPALRSTLVSLLPASLQPRLHAWLLPEGVWLDGEEQDEDEENEEEDSGTPAASRLRAGEIRPVDLYGRD